jgi:hypothetical protein
MSAGAVCCNSNLGGEPPANGTAHQMHIVEGKIVYKIKI